MRNYQLIKLRPSGWLRVFQVNKVVKHFVLADLSLFSGWGLVAPIFSIFIIEDIPGANLVTVGAAAGIYWLVRAVIQLPIAIRLDKIKGEKDNFYALLLGLVLASLAAFAYTLIRSVEELYLTQVLQAIAFGFYAPAWLSIFNRHLDKERVAFDLSLDSTVLALASGVTGFLGGFMAETFGFRLIFLSASFFSLISAVIIFLVPEIILPRPKNPEAKIPLDHTPRSTP